MYSYMEIIYVRWQKQAGCIYGMLMTTVCQEETCKTDRQSYSPWKTVCRILALRLSLRIWIITCGWVLTTDFAWWTRSRARWDTVSMWMTVCRAMNSATGHPRSVATEHCYLAVLAESHGSNHVTSKRTNGRQRCNLPTLSLMVFQYQPTQSQALIQWQISL